MAVVLSPLVANAIGSVFNVLYNQRQIQPLLSATQMDRFDQTVIWVNLTIYPIAALLFLIPLWRLRPIHRDLLRGAAIDPARLDAARRRVIHLPWWFLLVAAAGWLACVPVFPTALLSLDEPLAIDVNIHLITSFLIAALIAVTQSFFAVELVIQRVLFPVLFQDSSPAAIGGTHALTIRGRGVMWCVSAVISPVVSLVLLLMVPDAAHQTPLFALLVGLVAISFGLITSVMMGRLVASPIRQLRDAATRVARGNLDTRIVSLRADEFGDLTDRFNEMVDGLEQRERLQEVFGRHVGSEAARQIMAQEEAVTGREQSITVMFIDVRNFTQHSSTVTPAELVASLNEFFHVAVDTIEQHGGMVNKFLGDGLMAIFGIGGRPDTHGDDAIEAGSQLLGQVDAMAEEFRQAGWPNLQIGVGINTGIAVVGSIGSPKRQEYTAIGDVVNVAARVESLTKTMRCGLLFTDATKAILGRPWPLVALPPQRVKGKAEPIELFTIEAN